MPEYEVIKPGDEIHDFKTAVFSYSLFLAFSGYSYLIQIKIKMYVSNSHFMVADFVQDSLKLYTD